MLGFGILALFSLGMVGMIGGGGGDDDYADEDQPTTQDDNGFKAGDENIFDKLDPTTEKDIPDADKDTPDPADPDAQAGDDTEATAPARPPVGDGYTDPLALAKEAEIQRALDEIAAAEARLPENLVTISGDFGVEVPDDTVLTDAPGTTDPNDAEFVVTAPDAPNEINVGYDHEHTFDINYTAETTSITAALNSNIQGPEGVDETVVTDEVDGNDVPYTQTLVTKTFEGATDITLNVTDDQIGSQISQIDLSNPDDTLHFDFEDDGTSNYHLVFNEVEQADSGDTNIIKSAYVIRSDADLDVITPAEIAEALESGVDPSGVGTVVAEIFLGEDGLDVSGNADTGEDYAVEISNFVNDTPQITANVDWASNTTHDDVLVTATTATNSGVTATANGNTVSSGTGGTGTGGSGIADSDFRGLGQLYNAAFGLINR